MLLSVSALNRVDLPTFGRPTMPILSELISGDYIRKRCIIIVMREMLSNGDFPNIRIDANERYDEAGFAASGVFDPIRQRVWIDDLILPSDDISIDNGLKDFASRAVAVGAVELQLSYPDIEGLSALS